MGNSRITPRKKKKCIYLRLLGLSFKLSFNLVIVMVVAVVAMVTYVSLDLPDVTNLDNLVVAQSSKIYDRDGNLLYTIHGEENREEIPLDQITPYLVEATLAVEDDNFWVHSGFDVWGIGKAMMYEVFEIGSARGGSTLTQQYIKNTFLSSEKTYERKLKEIILAVRLERTYSKKEILSLYLNRIPYGNNAYGAEKASEIYFGKHAKDLTLAQSVVLAALPQAPSRYNPFGWNKYSHLLTSFSEEELETRKIESEADLEKSEFSRGLIGNYVELENGNKFYLAGRTDLVVRRMYDEGKITMEENQRALDELRRLEFRPYVESIKYPHFVFYIIQDLEKRYGKELLEKGGLEIYTTLDPELQDFAEEVIAEKADMNLWKFGADNAATLTLDTNTGEILTMVGSVDYFNQEIDGNVNVTLRPRQPGSSFKPFVYAQAFYNGYAPGNYIHDIPTKIGNNWPQNYDGSFTGRITIRRALAQSRNIPAVKAYYLGGEQERILDLVERMGITSLRRDFDYGYPLALGAGEVPLIQMVQGFSVFATNGQKPEMTGIKKIVDAEGNVLEELESKDWEQVINPQVAYMINHILSDRKNGIGPNLFLDGHINAAKTGTSTKKSKRGGGAVRPGDAWTIMYTPSYVTAVWVGNTDGRGMAFSANGYEAAAPIVKTIMTKVLEGKEIEPFPVPSGITSKIGVPIASDGTGTEITYTGGELFASFSVPIQSSFLKKGTLDDFEYDVFPAIANLLNWKNEVEAYYEGRAVKKKEEVDKEKEEEELKKELANPSVNILDASPVKVEPLISTPANPVPDIPVPIVPPAPPTDEIEEVPVEVVE